MSDKPRSINLQGMMIHDVRRIAAEAEEDTAQEILRARCEASPWVILYERPAQSGGEKRRNWVSRFIAAVLRSRNKEQV